ncbi:hypothetical protein ACFYY3_08220 [Streptomyces sp. NPDC001812]|uniref:hypothetical protein n=1 Tax=Streptomyces sp. NPDC001812 TaxID=3364611 RepID=UPI0036AFD78F
MRIRSALGVGLGGAVLALGAVAVPGQAVEAAPQGALALPSWCTNGKPWDEDGRTYGVRCDVTFAYYAKVTCTNGKSTKIARGVQTNDNRWSYAYCTSHGSNWRVVPGTGGPVRA